MTTKATIHTLLNEIQINLNAPKNQLNKFGGYSYRSCEDILEGLKPLLKDSGCTLVIHDEIVMVSDRVYVKATATLSDGKDNVSGSAFAREPIIKKGMDEAQVTGATSSYARKYALNGLFCIDDSKDADTKEKPTLGEQINGCTDINQLRDLWLKMNKKEQDENKELFGEAKTRLAA